jgi:hypothetical protein
VSSATRGNAEAQQSPAADRQHAGLERARVREYLYIKGARLEELHPISTLPAGNLLNITLFSYAGQLFFGLIATTNCRTSSV